MKRLPLLIFAPALLAAVTAGAIRVAHRPSSADGTQRLAVFAPSGYWTPPAAQDSAVSPVFASFRESRLAAPDSERSLTLIAVGDVMLSRNVAARMSRMGRDYPFALTVDLISGADLAFGNLETPITAGRAVQTGETSFRADPGSELALKDAGFDVLSLANNHTPNKGPAALAETVQRLDDVGLKTVGAGPDAASASAPVFVSRNGIVIAFLAYNDSDVVPASYAAAPGRWGTAFMDAKTAAEDVKAVKAKADVVIVSMHSGNEYQSAPNRRQTGFAHAVVDAGADLVIGHHPHVVQTAEVYNGKYIFYSLGNFVFDQMWSEDTRNGLVLKAVIGRDGVRQAEVSPVTIQDYSQPALAAGDKAVKIFKRLASPSVPGQAFTWDASADTFVSAPRFVLRSVAAPGGIGDGSERLDGDVLISRGRGTLDVSRAGRSIWKSADSEWVESFSSALAITGDATDDLAALSWIEENGIMRQTLRLIGIADGQTCEVWHSPPLGVRLCAVRFVDLDGDGRDEQIALQGPASSDPACEAADLVVWKWSDTAFRELWRAPSGRYSALDIEKVGGKAYILLDIR